MDLYNGEYVFQKSDTISEILECLNKFARSGEFVFRGYNKQEELFPNIIRDKTSYEDEEESFLIDFEKYGSNYFHVTSPIDFMSYAQHFGIPTRLLDFTYNPLIALYFALFSIKGSNNAFREDNDFYYIRYASTVENICLPYIMHTNLHSSVERPLESMADKAFQCIQNVKSTYENHYSVNNLYPFSHDTQDTTSLSENSYAEETNNEKLRNEAILFVTPSLSNQRITMQQGLFMFPYTLNKEKHKEIIHKNTRCIKIHKNHRNELLKYLDTLGYNTFRLMPDLGSICDAIKQRHKDKRMIIIS